MKLLQLLTIVFISGLCLVFAPQAAFAHGGAVQSFTSTTTEGRIIDIDYDQPPLSAESSGRFTFNLFKDGSRTKGVEYTDLWVRIVEGADEDGKRGQTIFAGPVNRSEYGGTGFLYVFANPGKYTFSVRYNDSKAKEYDDQTLGEASFQLDVLPAYGKSKFTYGNDFWLGVAIGALVFLFIGAFGTRLFLLRNAKTN